MLENLAKLSNILAIRHFVKQNQKITLQCLHLSWMWCAVTAKVTCVNIKLVNARYYFFYYNDCLWKHHSFVFHWRSCMIQLVWLCKIPNSYKLYVKIFVWYNCWKIGWFLFLSTCMKEIDQSHFTFCNAELFWRKIFFIE